MFKAAKKILILKPWYIALYLVVLTVLIASSIIEYQSRYRDLLQLIQDQAAMTAGIIAQSGSGQAYLTEELKQSYIDRAIDILTILNKIDAAKDLGTHRLDELVDDSNILKVIIYDRDGQIEHAVTKHRASMTTNANPENDWVLRYVQPILENKRDIIVAGVDQGPVPKGESIQATEERFIVAIARDRGGAFACHLSVTAEEQFKYTTAIEAGLEDLLYVKGLRYIQINIDNGEPYYVSRDGLLVDETWSRKPLENILYELRKGDTQLLEVVRPVFFATSIGEVRIGFTADNLLNLRGQIIYRILLRTSLITVLALVVLMFLLTRQNAALLAQEKKHIESEVYRLEKLNRLNEKQVAMGELAAGVAHEIRNPLNAIGIVAQRLKREFVPEKDVEDYMTLTGTMVNEIGRINQSLNDFLEYTRPTPLKYSEVKLGSLFKNMLELYHSQASEKQVQLNIPESDLSIEADTTYLQQALSNLIKNAIEACEAGEVVSLQVKRVKDDVIISVRDNGAGIEAQSLNRIFDLYYTTKSMGTGVGLALTHKIIADHSGTIEVQSELGNGTVFEINLPVKK